MKIAVKHADAAGVGIFLKELNGTYLATPPGLSAFTGAGRPKPSPVVRLFSYLTPKTDIEISIDVEGTAKQYTDKVFDAYPLPEKPMPVKTVSGDVAVPLIDLAWARSGDKGDKANIGVIARQAEYLPYIWVALTSDRLSEIFAGFSEDGAAIERFFLPGSNAMNIVLDRALGGGGAASLRNDAQGKGFAQILLAQTIHVTAKLAEALKP